MSRKRGKIGRPDIDLAGTGLCAAFNLRRTSRVVTALYDSALAASDLNSAQVAILIAVAKSEPVSIETLARIILADHSTLSRNLSLLCRAALLSVSPRSAMRRKLVCLTPEGTASLARSIRQWRGIQARFVGSFGMRRWLKVQKEL